MPAQAPSTLVRVLWRSGRRRQVLQVSVPAQEMIVCWKWEVKDPKRRSGWRLLRWRMTEEDAAAWAVKNGEVRRVKGSAEERTAGAAVGGRAGPLRPEQPAAGVDHAGQGMIANRQSGQAMLLTVLLIAVGAFSFVFTFATPWREQIRQDKISAESMALAKDALIGYAASSQVRPGQLPCPDTNNDGVAENWILGGECPAYIGRLPWITLGLPDLRDGAGERLWYTVTRDFSRDQASCGATPCPVNPDTAGQFTVDGVAGMIAVIFSPGLVVTGQNRGTGPNTVSNYLEGTNADGDNVFAITVPATEAANDRMLAVTNDQMFQVVNVRVAKDTILAVEQYRGAVGYFPFANQYGTASPFNCTTNVFRGRFPTTPTGCGQPAWPALPVWFGPNNWSQVTHYAISKACGQLGLPLGLDSLLGAVCDLLGNLSTLIGLLNTVLSFLGLPALVDEPITITGISTNVRALVIVSGRALTGQAHPCTTDNACLEDSQNNDGDAAYQKPSRYPASNDRMAVLCATNSPCAYLP